MGFHQICMRLNLKTQYGMVRNSGLCLMLILVSVVGYSQNTDSIIFTFEQFYSQVINHHPIAKQAALLTEQASQEVRIARGSFDPKIEAGWNRKFFSDTPYYDKRQWTVKIPTLLSLDLQAGVEQNEGQYLNPENFISEKTDNKQVFAGVTVPLGKGLFIDDRRAVLRKAQVFQEMSEVEQVKEINKLLLVAAKDYWDWYDAYNNYRYLEQAILIADEILERTKLAYNNGELAAVDTIQAFISYQRRIIDFQQAEVEKIKASLQLSIHLWDIQGQPLVLQENAIPESVVEQRHSQEELEQLLKLARANHPDIKKLELKSDELQIEERLARENLKPRLDVGYYLLDQPFTPEGDRENISFRDNYKVGAQFSFPLLLRKERAKLNLIQMKLLNNNFARDYREREIINEVNASYVTLRNFSAIVTTQKNMVRAYEAIVNAERLNMQLGESDLFKMNIQIDKLVESQSKLVKLLSTYKKNEAFLYWAAGVNVFTKE